MRTDRLLESWDGRDYERHSSHQRAWGSGLIAELSLRGDERILWVHDHAAVLQSAHRALRPGGVLLARTRQPDGTYLEPFRRMNVWARKAG